MKTYPIHKDGNLYAFEIDNVYVGPMIIAKHLFQKPGIAKIQKKKLDDPDSRLNFRQ